MDTPIAESQFKAEVFKDDNGEWRWHVVHNNGKIVADSGEGYADKTECAIMCAKVVDSSVPVTVVRRRRN